jgi:hypothetical protein
MSALPPRHEPTFPFVQSAEQALLDPVQELLQAVGMGTEVAEGLEDLLPLLFQAVDFFRGHGREPEGGAEFAASTVPGPEKKRAGERARG